MPAGLGSNLNQLHSPQGIYIDSSNTLYIADSNNFRVLKWTLGASEGTVVAGGNGSGSANNQLAYPGDFVIDSSNNLYSL